MRARPLSLPTTVPSAERIQEHQKAASPPPQHFCLVWEEVDLSVSAVSEVAGCLLLALFGLVGWFQAGGFLLKGEYLFCYLAFHSAVFRLCLIAMQNFKHSEMA